MKNFIRLMAVICFFMMADGIFGNQIKAQTVSTTVTYSGFQACGGCTVCGADYWCFNTPGSYCGNTTACGTKNFTDPVPPGNIVTNIAISYFSAQCGGKSLTATINGVAFPAVNEGNNGCPCSVNPCGTSATTGQTFPCGVSSYNYGGTNSLQLCTGKDVCINKLVLTITYRPANEATPATQPGAITGNNSSCSGTPTTFTIPAVANATTYTWTVPAGWTINSGQGTTSMTATPGASGVSGNICVVAKNLCGTSASTCMPVTVDPKVTPTFTNPGPVCSGTSFTLPTPSNNGISGTWTPAVNTTTTTTYTFAPSTGSCAVGTTMQVVVTPKVTPTFTNPGPICSGATLNLPTTSNNGVVGAWSPAVDNTTTTTYTFTPSGTCATSVPMQVVVTASVTPKFTNPGPVCSGTSFTLPATSNNGVSGAWSPAVNNTTTTTYTFTPSGTCASSVPMQVVIDPKVSPTFTNPGPICSGASLILPTTSNNGVVGTWSPAVNNTATTNYTFTPNAVGACVNNFPMQVVVNPQVTPTFTNPGPICSGATLTLPTTSTNGVTGTWSPAADNTTTTTYTFTPSGAGCAVPNTMQVVVNPLPTATISGTADVCQSGTAPTVTFTGANGTAPYTFTYTLNGATSTVVSTGATATVTAPTTTAGTFTYVLVSVQDASTTTCSNPQTGTVTVNVKPKPVIALNTSSNTICSGSGVTITPSSTPTGATFGWTVQNVNTSGASNGTGTVIANNLSTTGINAGSTTYTVTGTLNGCVSDPVNSVITVNPVPVASAQAQTICSGKTTSITLNSNISNTTFSWTNVSSGVVGASNGSGAQINQSLTSLVGGTVTYTVTPTLGTCTGTPINVIVTVNATPSVSVTPTNSDVCQGSSVTLIASGAATYTWSPAAGLNSTTSSSVIATPSATTTYTVTGKTALGCEGTSQATIIVRPYPVLIVSPDATICLGESALLTANGATTYTWSPTASLNATTGATVVATPTSTTTYLIKGTSFGCSTVDSIKIAVNPLPTVDAGVDQTVCQGVPVILTATGVGIVTYSWNNGVVNGVPFVVDTTKIYTVTGIDANGCKNVDYVTVHTMDAPGILFTVDTTLGCAPLHVQFTNNTVGATSYFWDFGDGKTSTSKNPYHDFYVDTCVDVTFTADNGQGCAVSVTMTDYICVLPSPTAAFVASTYNITNVMNEVFFNNQSQNAISYEWYFVGDESGVITVTHPKYAYDPTVIRNHTVTLVAKNEYGCTDTARVVITMTEDVVFYVPNTFTPDGDQFNNIFKPVFVEGYDGYEYEMYIFDRWGELIFETHDFAYGWDGTYKFGTGEMCQDGVYAWKIIIKKKGVDERITKSGHVTLIR